MGDTSKLISGILLFIIGLGIAFVTMKLKLLDFFLYLGVILVIVGVILVISNFVGGSSNKTKEFISKPINANFTQENRNNKPKNILSPQKTDYENSRRSLWASRDYDYSHSPNLKEYEHQDYDRTVEEDSYLEQVGGNDYYDDEPEVSFDNTLNFTPNYDRPLKVTRRPRRREQLIFEDDVGTVQEEPVIEEIETINLDDYEDRSEEIAKALEDDADFIVPNHALDEEVEPRDIKIDLNDPESLPVPKLLNSFVVCKGGILTSKEAFELIAADVKKEVMLQIPKLTDLSEKFVSTIPSIYSRIIIEDFSIEDINTVMIVSSLLKQGVHIKTIPIVNTINLIIDDDYALIISDNSQVSDIEYGAVYTDRDSISEIRAAFDTIWDIASDLDQQKLTGEDSNGN